MGNGHRPIIVSLTSIQIVSAIRVFSLFCLRALSQCDSTLRGYDVVIMSDLLHFDTEHGVLVSALTSLLAQSEHARVYVAAGKYTAPHVCGHFLDLGAEAGLTWQEGTRGKDDDTWRGAMVRGLDAAQLGVRKQMCRWWVGRWSSGAVERLRSYA